MMLIMHKITLFLGTFIKIFNYFCKNFSLYAKVDNARVKSSECD